MKPALAAAVLAVAAAVLAGFALARGARRGEELERRVAALEADLAAERSKRPEPVAAPATDPKPAVPAGVDPVTPPDVAKKPSDKRLAKLEAEVDRLEDKVRDLSRASGSSIDTEIAGLSAEKLWDKSQMALHDKLTERADALLRDFLKQFPNDPKVPEALLALGNSEMRVGDMPEAREFYDQILRDYPGSGQAPYAEFYTGAAMVDAGDLAGARTHYEKSIEGLAKNPYWQAAALYNLGDAYKKAGQPEVAKDYFRKVTAQYGANPDAKEIADLAAKELQGTEGK